MRSDESSQTARGAAALRAAHMLAEPPLVFEDPYALSLAGEQWQAVHARGELRETFRKLGLERLEGQIVGRARWAEDALGDGGRQLDQGAAGERQVDPTLARALTLHFFFVSCSTPFPTPPCTCPPSPPGLPCAVNAW